MAQVIGVRLTKLDGTTREWPEGRKIQFDGYADLQVLDDRGNIVGTRTRAAGWDDVDLIYADESSSADPTS